MKSTFPTFLFVSKHFSASLTPAQNPKSILALVVSIVFLMVLYGYVAYSFFEASSLSLIQDY
ncbi:hypothetical protein M0D21_18335 [Aquimarina sp. D1M17]|uniref:hypothetical protein n=1 Tax=Aquimarina acroporae TaxID=2937283 RepID=UPI0020BD4F6D|nr:hypothetical protein [Aquimarina acroporae]MCK8523548.1 hypothetical protein [Aquimarina acroporae]